MFTGIIQKTARIQKATVKGKLLQVAIQKPKNCKLVKGQSVSVDGICSTIVSSDAQLFYVEYMPETLSKTLASNFIKGTVVNLERSLTLNDFVDGGLVLGHVDTTSRVLKVLNKADSHTLEIQLPKTFARYIAPVGGITINGVNLTVARKSGNCFTVALIPYTVSHTNLGLLKSGDRVNIEIDLIARYVLNSRKYT